MSDFNQMDQSPKWYIIHTFTGFENKVKTYLERLVENQNLQNFIFDIQVPTQVEEYEDKKGNKKERVNVVYPSYVFVKMIMNDRTWHVVRNITGVTGFVGPGSKPVPLPDDEVARLQVEEIQVYKKHFEIGNKVKIIAGAFSGYNGTISEISEDGTEITVLVNTANRDLPVFVEEGDIELSDE